MNNFVLMHKDIEVFEFKYISFVNQDSIQEIFDNIDDDIDFDFSCSGEK